MKERAATQQTSAHNVVMLAGLVAVCLSSSVGTSPAPTSDTLAQRMHAGKVADVAPAGAPQIAFGAVAGKAAAFDTKLDAYYEQLRSKMRWLPVKYAGNVLQTPDVPSRLLLARAAASRAGLDQVGLSYRDVYGIINAETSWIPRMGSSKDGTPNLGIAQFEPATAKAVGLTDPTDPVEAVHAMAVHLKEAAIWSAKRIDGLKLPPEQYAQKLREGVSIYYNLSSKGRSVWNGKNTAKLPIETQRHIANARLGARQAAELDEQLRQVKARVGAPGMMTASFESGN
ncbi:hypothetical protein H8N03_15240 [Ramlibacter sp. USB13]|uniref:Lytic transglycosylase domain-containing protein n=1 Tax=Ramlibacter cellulosilyticus TaxID=2764187 RepID=A0A923MST8_9BURK|nr:hypothetical protein [Ramlibacter cellulosilyticus]MBC5784306.1 hypothetical protein [Ramlibacter cellulosilyticus]